jgi:hypothetical protein
VHPSPGRGFFQPLPESAPVRLNWLLGRDRFGMSKPLATSEDLSVRTPEPGPRAGTNTESGTNRQNGVGSEWQAGNIPEFLQQSFATRANASNGAAAAG